MLAQSRTQRFALAALLAMMITALACEKSVPGPTTEDFTEQREALKARIASGHTAKKPPPAAAKAASAGAGKGQVPSFGAVGDNYVYDSTGKRDPFRSFMWTRPDRTRDREISSPLENFDLSQLSLVAVVWKTGSARALVQDPAGESYIVAEGSPIGRNEGRVISIDDSLMVVKETYVDHLGQETVRDIEMRMRRNEGG
jgi:type IV pilus assembly protein PilP